MNLGPNSPLKSPLQAMACHDIVPEAVLSLGSVQFGQRPVWEMMGPASHNRWRLMSAGICLLAVLFLYTPHAVSAWMAHDAACCASGMCPIKEHHHHQAPAQDSHQMDCGHDMSTMMDCSMSCCQHSETPAVASAIFILPLPVEFSAPTGSTSAVASSHFQNSPRSIQPLSPPPRFVSAVA